MNYSWTCSRLLFWMPENTQFTRARAPAHRPTRMPLLTTPAPTNSEDPVKSIDRDLRAVHSGSGDSRQVYLEGCIVRVACIGDCADEVRDPFAGVS